MYVNDRDEINYHGFLYALRTMQNATLWDVATGICTDSEINRVELGERQPEKLMRDRISSRLGVSGEEYEDYLHTEEYRQWLLRQDILKALDSKNLEEAKRGIDDFSKIKKMNCVQEQFVEVMRYILMQLQGASREELFSIIEHAIAFTVPDIDAALERAHLLADQEFNLIIEYISLKKVSESANDELLWKLGQYEKMISLIENSYMDTIGKSKILPRIACNMSKIVLELNGTEEQKRRAIEICDNAVAILRRANRVFYFVEVLEYHGVLLAEVKPYGYKKILKRNTEWIDVFKELYAEYGLSVYTETFCYLYWESECHNIVDVLEVRRGMTGLSRVKLSDNICADKTIVRYERYGVSPSLVIVRDLFERMGLCAEYKRARVITSDPEVLYLSDRLANDVNNYNPEDGEQKLAELKEKLNMDISFNKQEIIRTENMFLRMKKEVNNSEHAEGIMRALEATIAYEDVLRKNIRYFTRAELKCMHNLAFYVKGQQSDECREIIEELCKEILDCDMRKGCVPVYEFLTEGVVDYLGDVGKLTESTILCEKMLKESLKSRRMFNLAHFIYHNLWNKQAIANNKNSMLEPQIVKNILRRCIMLSDINGRTALSKFLKDKLDNM